MLDSTHIENTDVRECWTVLSATSSSQPKCEAVLILFLFAKRRRRLPLQTFPTGRKGGKQRPFRRGDSRAPTRIRTLTNLYVFSFTLSPLRLSHHQPHTTTTTTTTTITPIQSLRSPSPPPSPHHLAPSPFSSFRLTL